MNFRRQTAVYAEELLVHEGSERQTVEGIHARVVHPLGVFNFTWKSERETQIEVLHKCLLLQEGRSNSINFMTFSQVAPDNFLRDGEIEFAVAGEGNKGNKEREPWGSHEVPTKATWNTLWPPFRERPAKRMANTGAISRPRRIMDILRRPRISPRRVVHACSVSRQSRDLSTPRLSSCTSATSYRASPANHPIVKLHAVCSATVVSFLKWNVPILR